MFLFPEKNAKQTNQEETKRPEALYMQCTQQVYRQSTSQHRHSTPQIIVRLIDRSVTSTRTWSDKAVPKGQNMVKQAYVKGDRYASNMSRALP